MAFEYDPAKSAANLAKHGIDFEAAQALWMDDRRLVSPSNFPGEERSVIVGTIDDHAWAAAVTLRGAVIRIISVRRARVSERERYDRQGD